MANTTSAIRQALERLNKGSAAPEDKERLLEAKRSGKIALALGGRSVAIVGDVTDSPIITGDITLTKEALEWLFPPTLHTLAAPVADFTGRDAEIADLIAALRPDGRSDAALISGLRGMGGIGKTELARKVGQLLATAYPDAQLEIPCQVGDAPKTAEQLLAAVAAAGGVPRAV